MQFDELKRREFITLLGGAAIWPFAARAQPHKIARIGFVGVEMWRGVTNRGQRSLRLSADSLPRLLTT